jgi:hypothetical protein
MFEGTGVPMDKVLAEFFATPTGKLIEANVDKVPVSELKDFRESKLKMIYQIRKELTRSVRNIPHARGGRPGLLHEDEKRQACKDVLRLVEDGEDVGEALKQVARQKSVSLTTIRRYWRERAKLRERAEK